MFFRFNRKFKLLDVPDSFAKLVNVDNEGTLEFEFCYNVKQSDVVSQNAMTTRVRVISRTIQKKPLLNDSQEGNINTLSLVKNILSQIPDAKTAQSEQENSTVATRMSDIKSRINTNIFPQLRAKVPKTLIRSLSNYRPILKSVSELKANNIEKPILHFHAHNSFSELNSTVSASFNVNTRQVMYDMIVKQGIDPSTIVNMTHRSLPAKMVFGGLTRSIRAPENSYDPAVKLLHHRLFDGTQSPFRTTTALFADQTFVNVAETVINDSVEVPVRIKIPRGKMIVESQEQSTFFIKFELLDGKTGSIVDTVTRLLDVSKYLRIFFTPAKPPIVTTSITDLRGRVTLQIKQVDPSASAVQVYKKIISRATTTIDDYALIDTRPLLSTDQAISIVVDKPIQSTFIYRVIPIGSLGQMGSEYTNVVVNADRYCPIKAMSVTAEIVDTGIEVNMTRLPPDIVAIELLRRDMTVFEHQFKNIGGIKLIDENVMSSDNINVFDISVRDRHIYEYVVKLIYKGGTTTTTGNTVLEYNVKRPGKVDLSIEDLEVDSDESSPNVSFRIRSALLESDVETIRVLLNRQDIAEFFKDDILREREFLNDLISWNVQRIDLTTGDREDFGVITNNFFNDRDLGKNNSVKPLSYGHKYRYEVTAFLRSPETLFQSFEKEKVDDVTKKTYRFKPSKFLHPLALTRGLLVSRVGLKTRFSKAEMSHGVIGTKQSINVNFDEQPARVIEPSAVRFNSTLNILTWKLAGAIDQIDHFLIMKDVHEVRTMIGKVHSEFPFGNCQFIHKTSDKDESEFTYVIVPIFNDYSTGESATSNSVIV